MLRKFLGELCLFSTAIIWGSGFAASAMALEHYSPFQILGIRFVIGSILLSIVFIKKLKWIKWSTIKKGFVLGTFLYIAFALQTVGLQFTTPSKNAFLTAVNVVIVPFIGFLLYKYRIDKFEFLGAFLAMIGVGVMSLQLTGGINIGDFLTLLCAIAFAFQIFYTSLFVQDEDPILLTLTQMVAAAVLANLVVLFRGDVPISMNLEGTLSVVYLGVFSTTIAYLLQTFAQKFTNPTKTAIILSTESVWGMIFSILFIKELVTLRMYIGALIILLAILIAETRLSFLTRKSYTN